MIVCQQATWKSTHRFFCIRSRKKTQFLQLSTDILTSSSSNCFSSQSHKSTSITVTLLQISTIYKLYKSYKMFTIWRKYHIQSWHSTHVASSHEQSYINKFYTIPLLFCRFFKVGMFVSSCANIGDGQWHTFLKKKTLQMSEYNKDEICTS